MPLLETITEALRQWQQHFTQMPEQTAAHRLQVQESWAQELGQQVARLALQELLSADGKGYVGTQLPCGCGAACAINATPCDGCARW